LLRSRETVDLRTVDENMDIRRKPDVSLVAKSDVERAVRQYEGQPDPSPRERPVDVGRFIDLEILSKTADVREVIGTEIEEDISRQLVYSQEQDGSRTQQYARSCGILFHGRVRAAI
jgi:hypothetical protein